MISYLEHIPADASLAADIAALMAPARRVPLDIWAIIFSFCVSGTSQPLVHSRSAPMLLSHICRSWRELAISTSKLWSSMSIVQTSAVPFYDETTRTLRVDFGIYTLVSLWISRSGRHPLSISWTPPREKPSLLWNDPNISSREILNRIWSIVIAHADRLQTLQITLLPASYFRIFRDLNALPLPRLQCLEISTAPEIKREFAWSGPPDWMSLDSRDPSEDIWYTVSRTVTMKNLAFKVHSMDIDWDRLTSLSIESTHYGDAFSAHECLEILAKGRALKRVRLAVEVVTALPERPGDLRSGVEHLAIGLRTTGTGETESTFEVMGGMFRYLRMPALRHFEIHSPHHEWHPNIELFLAHSSALTSLYLHFNSLSEFLSDALRSTPSLRTLRLLADTRVSAGALAESLYLVPQLRTLRLQSPKCISAVTEDMLNVLSIYQGDSKSLVPHLSSLEVQLLPSVSDEALVEMVESRRRPGVAIAQLKQLTCVCSGSRDLIGQAEYWRRQGMDVSLIGYFESGSVNWRLSSLP